LNAADEIAAAEEALAAAESLARDGLLRSAMSRACFAAFHAARALLFSAGLEPRSDRGARHLLNVHFVRAGKLDPAIDRLLAHAEMDREDADYAVVVTFTREQVADNIDAARRLLDAARGAPDAG
jgi:uncharacterized protein (UPF0332 family)